MNETPAVDRGSWSFCDDPFSFVVVEADDLLRESLNRSQRTANKNFCGLGEKSLERLIH